MSTSSTYVPQQFDTASTQAMLNPAQAAEHARTLAFESGYNDGLEKARRVVAEATDEANKTVRRTVASLREAIDVFDEREAVAVTDMEDSIVAAAFEIAKAIVQRELSVATDPGADAIARALQFVPDRTPVIARLNPQDAATLNVDNIPTSSRSIEVIADASVEAGGCIVEANETTIDAQISSALHNVRTALGLSADNASTAANGSAASPSRTTVQEPPLS